MKKKLLGLCLAALLAGCGEDVPKNIQETSRDITKVSETVSDNQKLLVIDVTPSSGNSNAIFFFHATENINKVLAKIIQYFPNQTAQRIDFIISTALSDKYGNTKVFPVLRLSFDMDVVRKINFKNSNFSSWDLLLLANPVDYLHPAGRNIVADYCRDESNSKFAGEFCQKSL